MVNKIAGVYKIVNIVNNKVYIGSSSDLKRREIMHFKQLKNNNHFNIFLQRSFNKYGDDSFIFEIIEVLDNNYSKGELRTNILKREQFWLDYFSSYNKDKGFNILRNAGSNLGKTVSEETRNKLRLARLGRKCSDETKKKIGSASKLIIRKPMSEKTKQKISEAHKGKKVSIENKVFYSILNRQYKHTKEAKEKISKSLFGNKRRLGTKLSKEHKEKLKKANQVKVINLDTGIIFNSIVDASRHYNIKSKSGISMCCSKKQKTCGGYKWEYL